MNTKKTILASVFTVMFAPLNNALANVSQTSDPTEGRPEQLIEVISVAGTRANLEAALVTKQASNNVVDSLSSEGVGRLPDLNLAESLQRLPGVQINRAADDRVGTVSLRGLPGQFSQTTLNGFYLATPDVSNFAFGTVRAEVFSGINVLKTPSSGQMTGGLSGVVDLRTGSPFIGGDQFQVALDVSHDTLSREESLGGAAVYIKEIIPDILAMRAAIGIKEQNFRADSFQINAYSEIEEGVLAPSQVRTPITNYDGISFTGSLGIEYRPTDNLKLELLTFVNDLKQDKFRRETRFDSANALNGMSDPISGENFDVVTQVTMVQPRIIIDNRLFEQSWESEAFTGIVTYVDDGWELSSAIHYTSASGESPFAGYQVIFDDDHPNNNFELLVNNGAGNENDIIFQANQSFGQLVNLNQDFTSGSVNGNSARNLQGGPGETFNGGFRHTFQNDEELSFHFDLDINVEVGPIYQLSFGGVYRDKEQSNERSLDNLLGAQISNINNEFFNYSSISGGQSYFNGNGSLVNDIPELDVAGLNAALTPVDLGALAANGLNPERYFIGPFGLWSFRDNSALRVTYENENDILGAYVSAEFEHDFSNGISIRGNGGLRYEETSRSTVIFGSVGGDNTGVAGLTTNTIDFDYDNFLPSVNLVSNLTDFFDLTSEFLLRFGYSETIRRPSVDLFAVSDPNSPASAAVDGAGDVFITLPSVPLAAFESSNIDLSFEYYNRPGSLISLAVFQKNVSNFAGRRELCPEDGGGLGFGAFAQQGSACVTVTESTTDAGQLIPAGSQVFITQFSNGDEFTLNGLEMNFQQNLDFLDGWVSGFGGQVNYTYIDFDPSDTGFVVPEISENSLNIIAYYEQDWGGIRLAYNWRDEFLSDSDDAAQGANRISDSRDQLDLSMYWNVNEKTVVTFEAFNITDEGLYEYEGTRERARRYNYYGQTFNLGVRYTF